MSLFERLKNKRYDLQEKKKFQTPPDPWDEVSSDNNRSNTTTDEPPSSSGNASSGGKSKGSGSRTTRVGGNKPKSKPTGRGFEDVTGEGIKSSDIPKTRAELEAKRKEYQINKDGVPSKEGIKRYAEKAKQLKSGSNVPVKLTQADLDTAKRNMVGGEPVKNKAGKVIGTTTGRYGGRLNPPATKAELDDIAAELKKSKTINAKPLPKVYDAKASKELGTDVFKPIRKKIPKSKTRPGKIIDTPKRRIKILKPLPSTKPLEPLTKTAYNPYKGTSRFKKVMTALKKNPKTALAAAAIGTGVYLYNRGKNNPKGIVPPPSNKGKIRGAKGVDIKFTLGGGDPSKGFKYAGRKDTNK